MSVDTREPVDAVNLSWRLPTVVIVALAIIVVGIAFFAGAAWQRHQIDLGGWQEADGYVGGDMVGIEYDDSYVGFKGSLPVWIDQNGSVNAGGWPDCLTSTTEFHFRFQAREITVDDTTTTEVVAIDCRGTYPLVVPE